MLRTGQSLHPASHPASRRRTGASLPGTLASPGTGLTPAGCPELVDRLRITNAMRPISWAQTNVCSHTGKMDKNRPLRRKEEEEFPAATEARRSGRSYALAVKRDSERPLTTALGWRLPSWLLDIGPVAFILIVGLGAL